MKRVFLCTLVVVTLMRCQRPPLQAAAMMMANPPSDTRSMPGRTMPGMQNQSEMNEHIRSNLQWVLDGDLILRGAEVTAMVDDQTITLTGTVQNHRQHERVLELVAPYIHERSVADNVTLP